MVMQAWIAVNLTANLQDSFTWNTRQIYLWLTAEYKTGKNQLNQAVFWNWIIESKVSIWTFEASHSIASLCISANACPTISNGMAVYRHRLFQLHVRCARCVACLSSNYGVNVFNGKLSQLLGLPLL